MASPIPSHSLAAVSGTPRATLSAERQLAKRILFDALFLGSLGDALLHDRFALGLAIWMAAFALIFVHALRQRGERPSREQTAWLGTALFFAVVFAWRDSEALLFYDFMAMLAALAMLAATTNRASPVRSLLGQYCRSLFFVVRRAVATGALGVLQLLLDAGVEDLPRSWRSGSRRGRLLRAALLALPILMVFGLLFGAADPLFVSVLSLPKIDVGTAVSHLFVVAIVTWAVGGWLYGALADEQKRTIQPARFHLSLGALEITTILGGLVALFALFVGVQVGWLFGGEQLVRSTTGLGYADYARHGFLELVMVALLIIPVLLGTRAALNDDDSRAIQRHRLLTIPLLVLIAGVMASAVGRMALYVHYYGLSTDRLFALVFMGWLAIVLAWFSLTTLRGRTRDFAAGMVITGFMTIAAVNVANPDDLVVRVNVARGTPIDYSYLTGALRADAVPGIVRALSGPPVAQNGSPARTDEVRERCRAVSQLMRRWVSSTRDMDWRSWNASRWRARRAIAARESELREVTCQDASGETPFGDRDSRPARPGEQGYVSQHVP
jgi:hypothetical protein